MPADVEPAELAALLDFAERARVDDWSLRSALVRYAQPQPERVSRILDLVRRIEAALQPQLKLVGKQGAEVWAAIESGATDASGPIGFAIALLRVMAQLDGLGDALAAWAADPNGPRPDDVVDRVTSDVARRLAELGVPEQERPVRPARQPG